MNQCSSHFHLLKQLPTAATIKTTFCPSRCLIVTTLPGRASSRRPIFSNGIAPSAIPLDTGSSSNVWAADGRLVGHAARRPTHRRRGVGGSEVCANHGTLELYADIDRTFLDLDHLQSTTRGLGSWSRPGDLGQPQVPRGRVFLRYTVGYQRVMTKQQYTYEDMLRFLK